MIINIKLYEFTIIKILISPWTTVDTVEKFNKFVVMGVIDHSILVKNTVFIHVIV